MEFRPDIVELSDFDYFNGLGLYGDIVLNFDYIPIDPDILELILNNRPDGILPEFYLVVLAALEFLGNEKLIKIYKIALLENLHVDFILPEDRNYQVLEDAFKTCIHISEFSYTTRSFKWLSRYLNIYLMEFDDYRRILWYLTDVNYLDLSDCDISDVSMLSNVKILRINSRYLKDVSPLRNAHVLDLSYCTSITDVSMLGGVRLLDLSYTNVTDVSALGNVHSLKLRGCKKITDVSALGGVYELDLSYANVKDISALGSVHKLKIKGCVNIKK